MTPKVIQKALKNSILHRIVYSIVNGDHASWPGPKSGGKLAGAGNHLWLLIFLVLFASRQKEHKGSHCRQVQKS